MSAYFFDIDGTLVKYHTNEWLPGAKEMLKRLAKEGHQIIFMTMRGQQDKDEEWSISKTTILLRELNLEFRILYGIKSNRIMVDDRADNQVVHHRPNTPWE